jgi:phosphatidylglycerophosphate synthase/putative flippase GtrA
MQDVLDLLTGNLSSSGRIWSAIAPALFLGSYFLLGAVAYALRVAVRGRFRDAEVEARGSSAILGPAARAYFAWVMQPVWGFFARFQIPPNAVTTLSVLLAAAAGVSVAVGRFALGGWLYLFAGACDFVDGRLARITGRATQAGAALDSVLDRYSESAVLVGLGWYYRDSWVLMAVMLALVGSMMVPYIRARGEGLGLQVKTGMMQRPERLVLLGVSVAFAPVLEAWLVPGEARPLHRLAVVALCIIAVSSQFTAATRLLTVMKLLDPRLARASGPGTLVRNVLSAAVATAADFGVVLALVKAGVEPWLSTAAGCLVGGVINFGMNRVWTFASHAPPLGQAWRYGFVSASSALLNSGGVAVLLFLPGLDYRIAWAVVRGAVFLAWNYPLHRDYVFTDAEALDRADAPAV